MECLPKSFLSTPSQLLPLAAPSKKNKDNQRDSVAHQLPWAVSFSGKQLLVGITCPPHLGSATSECVQHFEAFPASLIKARAPWGSSWRSALSIATKATENEKGHQAVKTGEVLRPWCCKVECLAGSLWFLFVFFLISLDPIAWLRLRGFLLSSDLAFCGAYRNSCSLIHPFTRW